MHGVVTLRYWAVINTDSFYRNVPSTDLPPLTTTTRNQSTSSAMQSQTTDALTEESTLPANMENNSKALSAIESVPNEILLTITEFLDNHTLHSATCVCQKLNIVATESIYKTINLSHDENGSATDGVVTLYCAVESSYPPLGP
jgi:hypothetical protein